MDSLGAMDPKRSHTSRPDDGDESEEKFVWVKKQKLDEQKGLTREELDRRESDRRDRNRREIEKLERQRLKWESEREQKQLEKERVQFGREKEMLGDWQEKERRFHLGQALAKAEVRIKAGRGDQFDWLIINTCQEYEGITLVSSCDPIEVLDKPDERGEGSLLEALEEHRGLEKDLDSLNYLDAIIYYLHNQQNIVPGADSHQVEVVKEEITSLLSGKNVADLTRLERGIKAKLSGPNPVDPTYWQGVLTQLDAYRRSALVRETNSILVERRKANLGDGAVVLSDKDILGATPVIGDDLPFAPTPVPSPDQQSSGISWDPNPEALRLFLLESNRKVSKDELPFNNEADDLSEPKPGLVKPRFFNRVRTCYEWNKYNQTHYDSENPPPKTVQGYRFNIFYPTLSESQLSDALSGKTSAPPSYKLEQDMTNPDMKIIRFRAAGPYDEVVFRIQSDEWDMSHRQGFKCAFEGGVLRLHFWFKSQRYTR